MQFAQFSRLPSSHFPLVGKLTTDETFTTSTLQSIRYFEYNNILQYKHITGKKKNENITPKF
jgi:hypothetical protein